MASYERPRNQPDVVGERRTVLHAPDVQQPNGSQDELPPHWQGGSAGSEQEAPQPLDVKEEEERPRPSRVKEEEEEADVSAWPLLVVSVKSEDGEDDASEPSRLHRESPRGDDLFTPLSVNDGHDSGEKQHAIERARTPLGEKPFCGPVCSPTRSPRGRLEKHVRAHTGEKPFSCATFGPSFSEKVSLATRMKSHGGEKPFNCSTCDLELELCPQSQGASSGLEQEDPRPAHVKEEGEEGEGLPRVKEEGQEADVSTLSPTVGSVKTEDHPRERSLFHQGGDHRQGRPRDNLSAARSDGDRTEEALRSDADRAREDRRSKCSEEPKTLGHVEVEEEDPQPARSKEEEAEDHVSALPLLVVFVKSEDEEDAAPEWSRPHRGSPSGDGCGGGPPPDDVLAPLSESDAAEDPWRGGASCEGGDQPSTCSEAEEAKSKTRFSGSACVKSLAHEQRTPGRAGTQPGEKPFSCSVCGATWSRKGSLENHMRTHTGEKPFLCSTCGQTFSRKENMVSHMKLHSGERPFACSSCGQTFSRRSNLERHVRSHKREVGGEKPFGCATCGKFFSQKRQLVAHQTAHTGERPFSCSTCGQTFSRKTNRERHMKSHRGEKPFSCSVCCKTFPRKRNLERHMRSHTGEKPFSC
uniref:C2H2-type domain-containing protein n=2 Tax=Hippocampus comes TaxID=109280 RepID=A0A3Q2Y0E9_HIPCM